MKTKIRSLRRLPIVSSNPLAFKATSLHDILLEDYQCNFDPDFQRDHVWTNNQQVKFIEWLIAYGTHMGPCQGNTITVNQNGESVLVDGKQRLQALKAFMDGEIKPFGLNVNDLDFKGAMSFMIYVSFLNLNDQDVLEYYIAINSTGTPHTEEEINKVKTMLGKEDI